MNRVEEEKEKESETGCLPVLGWIWWGVIECSGRWFQAERWIHGFLTFIQATHFS